MYFHDAEKKCSAQNDFRKEKSVLMEENLNEVRPISIKNGFTSRVFMDHPFLLVEKLKL